ncbi:DinB family protein [Paenibacillus azoreducens]|uniref:DinB family protein n=1 Tax=Paenibacillus azoreducens TaxID=116718 RepID=UPI0039F5A078
MRILQMKECTPYYQKESEKMDGFESQFHHRGQIVKMGRQLGHIPPKMNLVKP